MSAFLRFNGALKHQPQIDEWFSAQEPNLAALARPWFDQMRSCGVDVTELLHDGHPTACVGDAAFGYTNVFTSHVNIGFFHGASLKDPENLLQGNGRFMRHVKISPSVSPNANALRTLIQEAYLDIKAKLAAS